MKNKKEIPLILPIPRHLLKIFHPDLKRCDEYNLNGSICCDCGCAAFHIKLFADFDNKNIPHARRYKNGWSLVIQAVCKDCGQKWTVFDDSKHGYNGYVCHQAISVPDSELKNFVCSDCKDSVFKISISIETEDKEQFLEEVVAYEEDKFSEDDYVDAFNGIGIDIECLHCGKKEPGWIAYETA
ncbi:MAG: hypothetical protein K1W19_03980 [Lachnospiraceae bacterium]